MSDDNQSPEDLREAQARSERMETAKESAHAPIFVPASWAKALGRERLDDVDQIALYPFSSERKFACPRIGYFGTGSIESACMVIALCLLPPHEVDAIRGEDAAAAFRLRVAQWAEDVGIDWGADNEARTMAQAIRDEIMLRIEASQSRPAIGSTKGTARPNG